jgi:glycosyltransferase involved in cell wall biosynthesis
VKVAFASHTHMGSPFIVGSHHLARQFAKHGANVIHISTPVTPFHLIKYKDTNIQRRFRTALNWRENLYGSEHVLNYIPFTLFRRSLNTAFPSIKKVLQANDLEEVDYLLIDQPSLIGVEKHFKSVRKLVYRATDIYPAMLGSDKIAELEEEAINRSDAIIGTSVPVLEHLMKYNKEKPSLLLENGVDFEHFTAKRSVPEEYRPYKDKFIAVYVGAIDKRLDIHSFVELANTGDDVQIFIIGPYNDEAVRILEGVKNVTLLGERPFADVPAYMQHADLGLLPLSEHQANKGRSPMKLYEYAAAGLPVLSRATPELTRRNEDFISLYNSREEMTSAFRAIKGRNIRKEEIAQSAEQHSWNSKYDQLIQFLDRLN